MGITVLLPGGFKPPHAGHAQLANEYAKDPNVSEVLVLLGPTERDGITAQDSTDIWKLLPLNPKVKVISVDSKNPMTSAYDYVLNMDNNAEGEIAMAASSKGDDAKRSNSFVNTINKYKTNATKDGRFAPKNINPIVLPIDVSPLLYKGRNDKYDGTGISASVLRQDIENKAKDEFATNYPNINPSIIGRIYNILLKKNKSILPIYEIIEQRAVLSRFLRTMIIEGGNAIPTSIPVDQKDIKDVIKSAISQLPKELRNKIEINIGSSGYKAQSGDIDIFIDEQSVVDYFNAKDSKEAKKQLEKYLLAKGLESKTIGRNVHIGIPYKDGKAQVDFMIIRDTPIVAPWHQHGPRGAYKDPEFKGRDIFILLNSIGKSLGLKFDPFGAKLIKRDTDEVITRDRDSVAKILLNKNATENDLNSVKSILKALENDPKREEKLAQAKEDEKKGIINLSFKPINESLIKEDEGPRIDHVEDLIYWKGYEGAKTALSALQNLDVKAISVKWDGSPAVVFGYDENNQFIFTDKNAFVNVKNPGKAKSPEEIKQVIVDRGARNGKDYSAFGDQMSEAFKLFKESAPKKEDKNGEVINKGYYKGDMLYFKTPELENGNYVIEPNTVKYEIKADSELGKKIGASKIGIVIHSFTTLEGKSESVDIKDFKQIPELLIVPPVLPTQSPKIDKSILSKANAAISKLSNIDALLNPKEIESETGKKPGSLNDLPNILYAYTNSRVENIKNLSADDFQSYVASSKLSNTKKETLASYIPKNKDEFNKLFSAIIAISDLKNSIIQNLDSTNIIQSSVTMPNGTIEKTGEGYVIKSDSGLIKLVNRGVFTAANRAKQR